MRILGKLAAFTAAALILTAPVANAAPAGGGGGGLGGLGGGGLGGLTGLLGPVKGIADQVAKPLLGGLTGGGTRG
ncbi:hypothetical protein ACQPZF_39940 [Actinosynnema sp. CS-041913]|uniref:hypothetical protein n=1 Tax=Actinosynnema sp. CS-041913 TaxID=3239917 RepID=UPI003D8A6A60